MKKILNALAFGVVSVLSLLGISSNSMDAIKSIASISETTPLYLEHGTAVNTQTQTKDGTLLTYHYSHYSHGSHASHESHASHYSSRY